MPKTCIYAGFRHLFYRMVLVWLYLVFVLDKIRYQDAIPFVPSLLVEFRKCLTAEELEENNEMIISYNAPEDPHPTGGDGINEESGTNSGTLILNATCAPKNISYTDAFQGQ